MIFLILILAALLRLIHLDQSLWLDEAISALAARDFTYTGIVFEVFDTNPKNPRSLFGGGRYDELTTVFGKPSVPAVGYGVGDVGIYNFMEIHNLLPAFPSTTDVYVAVIGGVQDEAQEVASSLREKGINVAIDTTDREVDAKIKTAVKREIPYALFIGEEEVSSKQ